MRLFVQSGHKRTTLVALCCVNVYPSTLYEKNRFLNGWSLALQTSSLTTRPTSPSPRTSCRRWPTCSSISWRPPMTGMKRCSSSDIRRKWKSCSTWKFPSRASAYSNWYTTAPSHSRTKSKLVSDFYYRCHKTSQNLQTFYPLLLGLFYSWKMSHWQCGLLQNIGYTRFPIKVFPT